MKQRHCCPPTIRLVPVLILLSLLLSDVLVYHALHLNVHGFTPLSSLSLSPYSHNLKNKYMYNNNDPSNNVNLWKNKKNLIQLNVSSKSQSSQSSSFPKVSEMKAKELREELQSYGLSTKSFFEKSELVDAVEKARAEGKKPINKDKDTSSSSENKSDGKQSSSSSNSESESLLSRKEKIAKEIEICNAMKVGELKKELEQTFGVSTKSFFEKSEFVRAVAEARVDGVKKTTTRGGGTGSNTNARSTNRQEEYDSSYREVRMQKFDKRLLLGSSPVIDVRLG